MRVLINNGFLHIILYRECYLVYVMEVLIRTALLTKFLHPPPKAQFLQEVWALLVSESFLAPGMVGISGPAARTYNNASEFRSGEEFASPFFLPLHLAPSSLHGFAPAEGNRAALSSPVRRPPITSPECLIKPPSWAVSPPSPSLTLPGPPMWLKSQHCPSTDWFASYEEQPTLHLDGLGEQYENSIQPFDGHKVAVAALPPGSWWSSQDSAASLEVDTDYTEKMNNCRIQ